MEPRPFRFLRNLGRSREIATVLFNYGFEDVVERLGLRKYLQWGRRIFFFRKRPPPAKPRSRGERIRLALEDLGATFIKFGQVVSTRPDLVPPDIIEELEKLQEHVPPFPSDVAVEMLEEQLRAPLRDLFADFDREPIAAGSLAQVHRARHHDGTLLAVKIRRPNVVREVERDLSLMLELAILAERHVPEADIFDPVGLVQYFARTIRREMNFYREARTLDEFHRLFRNDATLFVPKVYWNLTTEAVLAMEYVEGIHVRDLQGLKAAGISPKHVAANGARIFMKQAFEFGLFHGDPHPGNIRILKDGSICLLDYGMIGMIEEEQRDRLVDLFAAVVRRDVRRVVELIQIVGRPVREIDRPLLRADIRDFVENYYGLPLERLNVGNMLNDFVTILARHGIHCPADLMLLVRVFVTLEGVGRELDPDFNLASHLAPFVERILKERLSPRKMAERLRDETQVFLRLAHDVPLRLGRTLEKLSRDELKIQMEHRNLDHLVTEIDRSSNRLAIGLVLSALIIASALIILASPEYGLLLSIAFYLVSSLLGIWLIYGIFRSGRL